MYLFILIIIIINTNIILVAFIVDRKEKNIYNKIKYIKIYILQTTLPSMHQHYHTVSLLADVSPPLIVPSRCWG